MKYKMIAPIPPLPRQNLSSNLGGLTEEQSHAKNRAPSRLPHSQLPLEQVANHLLPGKVRRLPQRREVERAGQAVGEAEEEHGRDPAAGVFEREAGLGHLVLLGVAAAQVVHAAGRVDLGLVLAGDVGELRAGEDVEVVVGGVAAGVAFCADGGACSVLVQERASLNRGE